MAIFGGKRSARQDPEIEELPAGRRRQSLQGQEPNRPQAFSYYSQRSNTEPRAARLPFDPSNAPQKPATAPTDSSWWQNRIVGSIAVVAALTLLGVSTSLSGDPAIVTATQGGNAYFLQDPAVYRQTAAKQLSGSSLNGNKLLVDKNGVAQQLLAQYPELAQARLSVPLIGARPVITITPTRPSFILTTTDNGAYLLDEGGRALVSASQIADVGELSVPIVKDESGTPVKLGQQALPSTTVAFTEAVLGYLDAAGVAYSSVTLPAIAGELDVAIKGTPYYVKFNLTGEAKLQAGTFLAAKGRLDKDKSMPARYIDVRVPERAYYL